ncbi:hypothetical protein D9M69_545150 [compost metagenome]
MTWAYFSVSAMRSWVLPFFARYSPRTLSRDSGLNALGAGMLAAYWVSMTKPAMFSSRWRWNSLKPGSTKARDSSRARSARKFMKITASPSSTFTGSPMRVALTNSSLSPRS